MNAVKQINQKEFVQYLTAGNSTFTIKSLKTQKHFTYKVMMSEPGIVSGLPVWYIKLLNGPDNTSNYKDLAKLQFEEGKPQISLAHGATKLAPSLVALQFVFFRALAGVDPHPGVEIWSAGRCKRCGRKLTVPSSIESQIGPECATKSFISYF